MIWNRRNCNQKDLNFSMPKEAHRVILQQAKMHQQALLMDKSAENKQDKFTTGWIKPVGECIKINTDGTVGINSIIAGCGGLLRNNEGGWIKGFLCNLGKHQS
ncbi:Polynucleotidyl transferase, Ribonuclease H fold [Senna tora]|uniref:Polynucleotidyl transferase, Ribonuclease H fold n=1 Tax=Senna tora TaxID=362788 RepID=A0A834TKC2_9FABA|nr:Polynucleotidyl transferase, Ribonuclease H fold [Senna tora]